MCRTTSGSDRIGVISFDRGRFRCPDVGLGCVLGGSARPPAGPSVPPRPSGHDLAEGPPIGVVGQRQAGQRIPSRARRPRPEATAERQRMAPQVLVEATRPERTDQRVHRSPTVAPETRTDPRQTIPSSFVFGRVESTAGRRASAAAPSGSKSRNSRSARRRSRRRRRRTAGRSDSEVGSLSWRRLAWYSIWRRIGACSATKTGRPVVPARNRKRQPVGSLGLRLNLSGGELGQQVRRATSRSMTSLIRLTRSPSMRRYLRECMWSPFPAPASRKARTRRADGATGLRAVQVLAEANVSRSP